MKAPNDGLAHLHELMGGAELTTLNLGEVAARVVAHADARVLDAFWVEYGGDQAAVPSTPAWVGRLPLKTGHLALVSDRVVFFYDTLFNDECRHAFAFPPGSYQASWRKTRGMLTGKTERFRVTFEPPRGVDLKEVSGPVENPGAGDWVELVAGGGDPVATGELRTEAGPVQRVCLTAPTDGLLQQRAQPGTVNTARHTLGWVRAS